jgi:hypothetical protein
MAKRRDELKKRGGNQDQYPISIADARQMTLDAAGFDPVEIGTFVRRSTDKLLEKLDATKVQYFTHEGVVTDERVTEDTTAQIAAAKALADIGMDVMALRRRSTNDTPAPPAVHIDLSGWTVQTPTTTDLEVIDATPGH